MDDDEPSPDYVHFDEPKLGKFGVVSPELRHHHAIDIGHRDASWDGQRLMQSTDLDATASKPASSYLFPDRRDVLVLAGSPGTPDRPPETSQHAGMLTGSAKFRGSQARGAVALFDLD